MNTIMPFRATLLRFASTMPRKLLLYKQNASPPSCAVMMLADLLKLPLEYKEPALMQGEHKTPEFKKINPMSTIPVLVDGDFTLSESHAIIKYLVEKYGGEQRSALYPFDAELRALIDERMYFDAGVFFNRLRAVSFATLVQGSSGPTAEQIADIEDAYSTLELYLERTRYIAADHLTIADLSVGSTAVSMQGIRALDTDKYPKTAAWLDKLQQLDMFRNISMPGAAFFKKMLENCWNRNKA